jgi:hypothetical protein
MDIDIRDEIDRSFDEGPPIDDLDLILTRGQQVVRRRRVLGAASTTLAAALVAGIALMSTGGDAGTAPPGPAGSATATPAVPLDVVPVLPDGYVRGETSGLRTGQPVSLDRGGVVHVRPGVTILQTVPHPFGSTSAAAAYIEGGATYWWAGALDDDGTGMSTSTPAKAGMTFQEWVAGRPLPLGGKISALHVDPDVDPYEAIDLRRDGNIYVSPDIEVTELDQHPWDEPEGSWAVTAIYEQDGETHWFAGRQTGTDGTSASTPAIAGRTFADWVAEQQAALHQGGGA